MNTKDNDNIQDYAQTLEKLASGIYKSAKKMESSYGPKGSNVVIEESIYPYYRVTKDGKLINDAIYLADPVEMVGKNILGEGCKKQEDEVGDGRKTTSIILSAILQGGLKADKAGVAPNALKDQIDACLPVVLSKIDERKKPIDVNDIYKIALSSSENEQLSKIIGDAYKVIGAKGRIELDPNSSPMSYFEPSEGYIIRQGYGQMGYWLTHPTENKSIIENPNILVCKDKITSVDQLNPLLVELVKNKQDQLVIYCEDIDLTVVSRLAFTAAQGGFKTLIIKAPTIFKDWIYEDLCKLTGAKAVDSKVGQTFTLLTPEHLGSCKKIITTANETRLLGTKDVTAHAAHLKERATPENQWALRASWLNTKLAVIKLGASSEGELSLKIGKAKDAINACFHALQDGVVEGSGKSLLDIELPDTIGGKIVGEALKRPSQVLGELPEKVNDPANVLKSAVTHAISIAGTLLTIDGSLIIPPKIKELIQRANLKMSQI